MSNVQQKRSRVKPARSIRLELAPFDRNPGVVKIVVGKLTACYLLFPLASDFGSGYRLVKMGPDATEEYAVNLNGERSSCECKGFLRWHRCKHVEGLQALVNAGQLTHPNRETVAWDAVNVA